MQLTKERLAVAAGALRWVFEDLRFITPQITPEAAAYAFRAMKKLDAGSRAARGLFELVTLPIGITKWSDIPEEIWGAVQEALQNPGKSVKSRIGVALVVLQHRRLMQAHIDDAETFPCPDFHGLSLW